MNSNRPELVVYVLSYRRAEYVLEAIHSILAQQGCEFKLIVSENSPDHSIYNLLMTTAEIQQNPRVEVKKRDPSLASLDHFNLVIKEASQFKYFMIFHDDDVMSDPQCLQQMMNVFKARPELSAVSCNAYLIHQRTPSKQMFNPRLTSDVLIDHVDVLINHYLTPSLSHTPFPAYIYQTKNMEGLSLDFTQGEKHSDVTFLVKACERGPIFWLHEPLISYRRHGENDSALIDLSAVKSLFLYLFKKTEKHHLKLIWFFIKSFLKKHLKER